MKNIFCLLSVGITVSFFSSCKTSDTKEVSDGLSGFNADSLSLHIKALSADDFEGRKPFTKGETKTIAYLKAHFIQAGLEPGNGTDYFQEVPMVRISTHAAGDMQVQSPAEKFSLKGFEDYVVWTDKTDSAISLHQVDLVFAGYGVVAPEYNWNDYAGLDVKGKVVLVLVNDPGFNAGDSTLFKGKTMTYYGRWTYKFEEAARQGARGCLIVHNTIAASYPFNVIQNNWNTSRLRLDNRGRQETLCDMIGWVSAPAARKLLQAAHQDTGLFAAADKRGFKGSALNLKLSVAMKVKTEYNMSHNVIGKITGSKHPEQTIIYTAHWDHLGIGTPDETGDSIYNGALDNASGAAGLLQLARGFATMRPKPERTIVILAVTAEEQGLWGSAYYAQNPIYPGKTTLADINIDGLNYYGATSDLTVIGEGQSELEDYLKEELIKSNRVLEYETHPEAGLYYRSDHFNFAKAGVPALFIESGTRVIGKDAAYGKGIADEYTARHYHRPSDQWDSTWKLDGAIADLKLLFNIGKNLAIASRFPEWKKESEFKAIRERK